MIINTEDNIRTEHGAQYHIIRDNMVLQFAGLLRDHEKSPATIDKYTRDVRTFLAWLSSEHATAHTEDGETMGPTTVMTPMQTDVPGKKGKTGETREARETGETETAPAPLTVDKEHVRHYKQYLKDRYKLTSANSMLSALNTFFKYMGWQDCMVMIFKTQRAAFRNAERDLSIREYRDLVRSAEDRTGRAKAGGHQTALIMETLAGTGIRVSELPFITVAALAARRAIVSLKGKTRTVLINSALCRKLRQYCRGQGITDGSIFVTRSGRPIDRSCILRRMKQLSETAGVPREKIFPHNLRHLFAVTYYEKEKDIVRLADILGHANINMTRIYTLVTCETQLGILDQLGCLLNPAG